MPYLANSGSVLRKKAGIYLWLLVGFVPAWVYGLTKLYGEPDPTREELLLAITSVSLVASLWIVILRWEAVEQRRMPKRVRALLLGLTFFVAFAVVGAFLRWCTGSVRGMYVPIVLSAAPLSALLALIRLGAIAAGSVPAPGLVLDVLEPVDIFMLLFGLPLVWGLMTALAAAPRTRRKTCLFTAMVLSHYLVAAVALALLTAEDRQWLHDTWYEVPWFLTGWALAYASAHVLLWRSFMRNRTNKYSIAAVTIPTVAAPCAPEPSEESSDVHEDTLSLTRS